MSYKEFLIQFYLDEKGNVKKKNGIAIITLGIGIFLMIFSIIMPGKALFLPSISITIASFWALFKNRTVVKDDKIWVDDTIKRIDDPHKYS